MKIVHRYSGKESRAFWERVNALSIGSGVVYALGCVLQNIEWYVLTQLDNYETQSKREEKEKKK